MHQHPEFKREDGYDTIRTYLDYLLKNGIVTARGRLSDVAPVKILEELKEPHKTFDLNLDFALSISACPPGWTDIHPGRNRYLLGLNWYDDADRLIERKVKAMDYHSLSHGLCPDCHEKFDAELTKNN
jgi:hypothetical protein